jgi:hypothetical protein
MKKSTKKKILVVCALALVVAIGIALGGEIVPLIDPPFGLIKSFLGL